MKKTILISGVAGMIGSNLAHWLINNTEHDVIGIDDLSGGYKSNCPDDVRFKFEILDVRDEFLGHLFKQYKPDICYHFAAYASEGRANHIRKFIHENNTIGTLNVINACVNNKCKLIFTSSVAVYSGTPPFNEATLPNPVDEYGISKYMSELSIQVAGETQGLHWVIIRPRNVYGVNQNIFDPSRNLFGIFCYNALNNLPLTIFGDGQNKRSFTYIDDIMQPLYVAAFYNKRTFNLGSKYVYTIKEATEIFSQVSGYKNIIHSEPRHEVGEAFCKTEISELHLGYEDKILLVEGITKMWAWAKTIPMQPRMTPPKLETTINAHSSLL